MNAMDSARYSLVLAMKKLFTIFLKLKAFALACIISTCYKSTFYGAMMAILRVSVDDVMPSAAVVIDARYR